MFQNSMVPLEDCRPTKSNLDLMEQTMKTVLYIKEGKMRGKEGGRKENCLFYHFSNFLHITKLTVMISFLCQLPWVIASSYSIKY